MKERKPLKLNTELRFTNYAGGDMHFFVGDVIGFGGSCIVYDGYYYNNAGARSTVRIKECYPYKLHLTRNDREELIVADKESEKFEIYKDRIRKSFDIANVLHEAAGLTNYTANVFDIFEANNTVYIISSYVEGKILSNIEFNSLRDTVRTVISVAKCIDQMHKKGYLYLDIKTENILVYDDTFDLVQLFDFDSVIPIGMVEDITEYRISYSKGFAPIEQKSGNMSGIGKHTDVYSIGALLFYLLFGQTPGAVDCGFESEYDYEKIKWDNLYQQKLYKGLTVFFHNTLQPYHKDRYQNMSEALVQLTDIEKYADLSVPFICSAYFASNSMFIGREEEINALFNWYKTDEKLIFVTGMGGIGKSTVIREFVNRNKSLFDNVIYLQFIESVCETIADDTQFCINGYEKEPEESDRDYFLRKMKAVKKLVTATNTLLVIDNFDGELNEEFSECIKVAWKMIIITRSDMSYTGYTVQQIKEFKEDKDICFLFENNIGRKLKTDEILKVNRIAEIVERHTLILVLIAKQIARSYLDIDEALEIVKVNGFSKMAAEKIDYMQDGVIHYEKISAIIMAVYDVSVLSDDKKKCLKFCSLFDNQGIEVKEIKRALNLSTLDDINELRYSGWLEIEDSYVQLHPLVKETIHQIKWTDEYRKTALWEMDNLLKEIEEEQDISGYKKIRCAVIKAKSILRHCVEDECIFEEKIYKDLMFVTVLNSTKDQEDYIINNAEILFEDIKCSNPYDIIELYDYVVYILCQKEEYDTAVEYLDEAAYFAAEWKDNYVWGKYYDMLEDFYEALLDGAYYSTDDDEAELVDEMLHTVDLSIEYMSKSEHKNAKNLTAKYMLGKANLLIRSFPGKCTEARRLIESAKNIIERYTLEYAEVRAIYCMAQAWYYTLCEKNEAEVLHNLEEAVLIDEHRNISDLDWIDYFFVPAANMMVELENPEKALKWLEEAYELCNQHSDELPYIRKKMDLLSYELEVYFCGCMYDKCRGLLERVGLVNKEADEYGLFLEIPGEILNKI